MKLSDDFVVGEVINENIDDLENNHDAQKQFETYDDDDVDSLLQSDDEKETDEIQKFLLADVSDDDESDDGDSDTEETDDNVPFKEEQESNLKAGLQDTEMSEVDIQNQLLRDQDLSDSDEESSTDESEQEEVDNISYEEPGREREIRWMTEFRMMVNLSREISCKIRIFLMMMSWRVKEESDGDKNQSKS